MVDNFLHEERVKAYYLKFVNLLTAYEELDKHFIISHAKETYKVGDLDRLKRESATGMKERYKIVAEQLDWLTGGIDSFVLEPEDERNYLVTHFPLIAKAHKLIGLAGLEETGYVTSKIKKAVEVAERKKREVKTIEAVYLIFNVDEY